MRRESTKQRDRIVLAELLLSQERGLTKQELADRLSISASLVYESLWHLRWNQFVEMDNKDHRWHCIY